MVTEFPVCGEVSEGVEKKCGVWRAHPFSRVLSGPKRTSKFPSPQLALRVCTAEVKSPRRPKEKKPL